MYQLFIKAAISGLLIAFISEIAKRNTLLAAILASIPTISILSLIWLYHDTHSIPQLQRLSYDIFWLVVPSLSFFVVFPTLLQRQVAFYPSLLISISVMVVAYHITLWLVGRI